MALQSRPFLNAPIEDIRAFCVVAQAGSLSAAAALLNVTHSSLSRRVAHLEDWLGFRLFDRNPRGMNLTISGQRFFTHCQEGFVAIDDAIRDATDPIREREVVISTINAMAFFCLIPDFCRPEVERSGFRLRITVGTELINFGDGVDLAIRFGEGGWLGTRSVPIWHEWAQPAFSPVLTNALTDARDPEALLQIPLIHVRTDYAWQRWFAAQGIPFTMRPRDLVFDDQILALSAMQAGLGAGLNRPLINAEVLKSNLITDGFRRFPLSTTYHLVRPLQTALRPPAQEFARTFLEHKKVDPEQIRRFLSAE